MNLADLQTLLDYHYWARDRMLAALEPLLPEPYTKDLGNSFPSLRDTAVHILSAERIWLSRWEGNSPGAHTAPADVPDVATLRATWADTEAGVRGFLASLGEDDVHRRIEYHNLMGVKGDQRFSEMLQHLVNHASYHRGQITTMLRQLGAAPPKQMDLIAFYRDKNR
jgi:uncharacterized damage-inducible protein DinB